MKMVRLVSSTFKILHTNYRQCFLFFCREAKELSLIDR
ncbi:unnamed protein product [Schistosoma curassoni]|uniref:Uncharacterized protein n=1 Tax=Schistosoma curassoni TaxID=6186 RepID=A0A183KR28_9TREM|nr:unnamed protein product [Schistosoma curassoni]